MKKRMPFRIAFRQEGTMINAYLAKSESMSDAILLGCIRAVLLRTSDDAFESFMSLIRESVGRMSEEALGISVGFLEAEKGPEHERAGYA